MKYSQVHGDDDGNSSGSVPAFDAIDFAYYRQRVKLDVLGICGQRLAQRLKIVAREALLSIKEDHLTEIAKRK